MYARKQLMLIGVLAIFSLSVSILYFNWSLFAFGITDKLSIAENKNSEDEINFKTVTPEEFGAKGDGITDDSIAINNAIASSKHIRFTKNKTYLVSANIKILKSGVTIDLNESSLKGTYEKSGRYIENVRKGDVTYAYDGYGNLIIKNGTLEHMEICLAHAKNITIQNIDFKNSDGHFIQLMSCRDVLIKECTFKGIKDTAKVSSKECINLDPCDRKAFGLYRDGSPSYDGTNNAYITIENCVSEQGNIPGYTASQRLGFSHYHVKDDLFHDHITVRNNTVYGCEGMACMWFYDLHNSEIYDNHLESKYHNVLSAKYGSNNKYYNNIIIPLNNIEMQFLSVKKGYQDNLTEFGNFFYINSYRP